MSAQLFDQLPWKGTGINWGNRLLKQFEFKNVYDTDSTANLR